MQQKVDNPRHAVSEDYTFIEGTEIAGSREGISRVQDLTSSELHTINEEQNLQSEEEKLSTKVRTTAENIDTMEGVANTAGNEEKERIAYTADFYCTAFNLDTGIKTSADSFERHEQKAADVEQESEENVSRKNTILEDYKGDGNEDKYTMETEPRTHSGKDATVEHVIETGHVDAGAPNQTDKVQSLKSETRLMDEGTSGLMRESADEAGEAIDKTNTEGKYGDYSLAIIEAKGNVSDDLNLHGKSTEQDIAIYEAERNTIAEKQIAVSTVTSHLEFDSEIKQPEKEFYNKETMPNDNRGDGDKFMDTAMQTIEDKVVDPSTRMEVIPSQVFKRYQESEIAESSTLGYFVRVVTSYMHTKTSSTVEDDFAEQQEECSGTKQDQVRNNVYDAEPLEIELDTDRKASSECITDSSCGGLAEGKIDGTVPKKQPTALVDTIMPGKEIVSMIMNEDNIQENQEDDKPITAPVVDEEINQQEQLTEADGHAKNESEGDKWRGGGTIERLPELNPTNIGRNISLGEKMNAIDAEMCPEQSVVEDLFSRKHDQNNEYQGDQWYDIEDNHRKTIDFDYIGNMSKRNEDTHGEKVQSTAEEEAHRHCGATAVEDVKEEEQTHVNATTDELPLEHIQPQCGKNGTDTYYENDVTEKIQHEVPDQINPPEETQHQLLESCGKRLNVPVFTAGTLTSLRLSKQIANDTLQDEIDDSSDIANDKTEILQKEVIKVDMDHLHQEKNKSDSIFHKMVASDYEEVIRKKDVPEDQVEGSYEVLSSKNTSETVTENELISHEIQAEHSSADEGHATVHKIVEENPTPVMNEGDDSPSNLQVQEMDVQDTDRVPVTTGVTESQDGILSHEVEYTMQKSTNNEDDVYAGTKKIILTKDFNDSSKDEVEKIKEYSYRLEAEEVNKKDAGTETSPLTSEVNQVNIENNTQIQTERKLNLENMEQVEPILSAEGRECETLVMKDQTEDQSLPLQKINEIPETTMEYILEEVNGEQQNTGSAERKYITMNNRQLGTIDSQLDGAGSISTFGMTDITDDEENTIIHHTEHHGKQSQTETKIDDKQADTNADPEHEVEGFTRERNTEGGTTEAVILTEEKQIGDAKQIAQESNPIETERSEFQEDEQTVSSIGDLRSEMSGLTIQIHTREETAEGIVQAKDDWEKSSRGTEHEPNPSESSIAHSPMESKEDRQESNFKTELEQVTNYENIQILIGTAESMILREEDLRKYGKEIPHASNAMETVGQDSNPLDPISHQDDRVESQQVMLLTKLDRNKDQRETPHDVLDDTYLVKSQKKSDQKEVSSKAMLKSEYENYGKELQIQHEKADNVALTEADWREAENETCPYSKHIEMEGYVDNVSGQASQIQEHYEFQRQKVATSMSGIALDIQRWSREIQSEDVTTISKTGEPRNTGSTERKFITMNNRQLYTIDSQLEGAGSVGTLGMTDITNDEENAAIHHMAHHGKQIQTETKLNDKQVDTNPEHEVEGFTRERNTESGPAEAVILTEESKGAQENSQESNPGETERSDKGVSDHNAQVQYQIKSPEDEKNVSSLGYLRSEVDDLTIQKHTTDETAEDIVQSKDDWEKSSKETDHESNPSESRLPHSPMESKEDRQESNFITELEAEVTRYENLQTSIETTESIILSEEDIRKYGKEITHASKAMETDGQVPDPLDPISQLDDGVESREIILLNKLGQNKDIRETPHDVLYETYQIKSQNKSDQKEVSSNEMLKSEYENYVKQRQIQHDKTDNITLKEADWREAGNETCPYSKCIEMEGYVDNVSEQASQIQEHYEFQGHKVATSKSGIALDIQSCSREIQNEDVTTRSISLDKQKYMQFLNTSKEDGRDPENEAAPELKTIEIERRVDNNLDQTSQAQTRFQGYQQKVKTTKTELVSEVEVCSPEILTRDKAMETTIPNEVRLQEFEEKTVSEHTGQTESYSQAVLDQASEVTNQNMSHYQREVDLKAESKYLAKEPTLESTMLTEKDPKFGENETSSVVKNHTYTDSNISEGKDDQKQAQEPADLEQEDEHQTKDWQNEKEIAQDAILTFAGPKDYKTESMPESHQNYSELNILSKSMSDKYKVDSEAKAKYKTTYPIVESQIDDETLNGAIIPEKDPKETGNEQVPESNYTCLNKNRSESAVEGSEMKTRVNLKSKIAVQTTGIAKESETTEVSTFTKKNESPEGDLCVSSEAGITYEAGVRSREIQDDDVSETVLLTEEDKINPFQNPAKSQKDVQEAELEGDSKYKKDETREMQKKIGITHQSFSAKEDLKEAVKVNLPESRITETRGSRNDDMSDTYLYQSQIEHPGGWEEPQMLRCVFEHQNTAFSTEEARIRAPEAVSAEADKFCSDTAQLSPDQQKQGPGAELEFKDKDDESKKTQDKNEATNETIFNEEDTKNYCPAVENQTTLSEISKDEQEMNSLSDLALRNAGRNEDIVNRIENPVVSFNEKVPLEAQGDMFPRLNSSETEKLRNVCDLNNTHQGQIESKESNIFTNVGTEHIGKVLGNDRSETRSDKNLPEQGEIESKISRIVTTVGTWSRTILGNAASKTSLDQNHPDQDHIESKESNIFSDGGVLLQTESDKLKLDKVTTSERIGETRKTIEVLDLVPNVGYQSAKRNNRSLTHSDSGDIDVSTNQSGIPFSKSIEEKESGARVINASELADSSVINVAEVVDHSTEVTRFLSSKREDREFNIEGEHKEAWTSVSFDTGGKNVDDKLIDFQVLEMKKPENLGMPFITLPYVDENSCIRERHGQNYLEENKDFSKLEELQGNAMPKQVENLQSEFNIEGEHNEERKHISTEIEEEDKEEHNASEDTYTNKSSMDNQSFRLAETIERDLSFNKQFEQVKDDPSLEPTFSATFNGIKTADVDDKFSKIIPLDKAETQNEQSLLLQEGSEAYDTAQKMDGDTIPKVTVHNQLTVSEKVTPPIKELVEVCSLQLDETLGIQSHREDESTSELYHEPINSTEITKYEKSDCAVGKQDELQNASGEFLLAVNELTVSDDQIHPQNEMHISNEVGEGLASEDRSISSREITEITHKDVVYSEKYPSMEHYVQPEEHKDLRTIAEDFSLKHQEIEEPETTQGQLPLKDDEREILEACGREEFNDSYIPTLKDVEDQKSRLLASVDLFKEAEEVAIPHTERILSESGSLDVEYSKVIEVHKSPVDDVQTSINKDNEVVEKGVDNVYKQAQVTKDSVGYCEGRIMDKIIDPEVLGEMKYNEEQCETSVETSESTQVSERVPKAALSKSQLEECTEVATNARISHTEGENKEVSRDIIEDFVYVETNMEFSDTVQFYDARESFDQEDTKIIEGSGLPTLDIFTTTATPDGGKKGISIALEEDLAVEMASGEVCTKAEFYPIEKERQLSEGIAQRVHLEQKSTEPTFSKSAEPEVTSEHKEISCDSLAEIVKTPDSLKEEQYTTTEKPSECKEEMWHPQVDDNIVKQTYNEGNEENKVFGAFHISDKYPDVPAMLDAFKDTEVKHDKKHHNILSAMGSKVKHSLSKEISPDSLAEIVKTHDSLKEEQYTTTEKPSECKEVMWHPQVDDNVVKQKYDEGSDEDEVPIRAFNTSYKSYKYPDVPVMLDAYKDTEIKHEKKHHNILSGMGSKVKHSLSKVRKAITDTVHCHDARENFLREETKIRDEEDSVPHNILMSKIPYGGKTGSSVAIKEELTLEMAPGEFCTTTEHHAIDKENQLGAGIPRSVHSMQKPMVPTFLDSVKPEVTTEDEERTPDVPRDKGIAVVPDSATEINEGQYRTEEPSKSDEERWHHHVHDNLVEHRSHGLRMGDELKDAEVKHDKKHHNILSGVGSKVKHSIGKVKKAISGKSLHPKHESQHLRS